MGGTGVLTLRGQDFHEAFSFHGEARSGGGARNLVERDASSGKSLEIWVPSFGILGLTPPLADHGVLALLTCRRTSVDQLSINQLSISDQLIYIAF